MPMLKKGYGNVMDLLSLCKVELLILRKIYVKKMLSKLSTRGHSRRSRTARMRQAMRVHESWKAGSWSWTQNNETLLNLC